MKVNIVVADDDILYLKQLTNYLVKSTTNFEVHSFSQRDSLDKFLALGENPVGILLIAESMRCAATDNCDAPAKMLLVEDEITQIENYESVLKYQKTADLLNQIILYYGRKSGNPESIVQGSHNTKFIGVYSPVGGSGKTTLALVLAYKMGAAKQKAFYMNCERIDSSRDILPAEARIGMSELLMAVHGGEPDIGLRLNSQLYTAPQFGFSYVNPAESALEFNEIPVAEQLQLLDEIERIRQFDAVFLDFDSELNDNKIRILKYCDFLVVPFLPDIISLNKLKQLFRELKLHDELTDLLAKMRFVGNKIAPNILDYLQRSGLPEGCMRGVMLPVSGAMANVAGAMRSGALNQVDLDELLAGLGL